MTDESRLVPVGKVSLGEKITDESRQGVGFVRIVEPGARQTGRSLLYPAEFRAITQPGCVDVNRLYYMCSREAHKTSKAHYGKDRCATVLPAECLKDNGAWLK